MIIIKEKKLEEQLVPANRREFNLLKSQVEQDPMLKKQLKNQMDELPQYRHLYSGLSNAGVYPLLSILEFLIIEKRSKLLFSKAGNAFTGFVAYVEKGKDITGVKIASFYDDQIKANGTIVTDLRNFITTEMPTHNKIEWEVEYENKKAISMYQKAIPKWFPQYKLRWDWDDKKHRWIYTIQK
ncbi:MAG: hypothetical protein LBE13_16105 [Bacteroidales bacterium]|jgi:hypothetical protein|nr:hypothetical protein [Bacteroidales bacterium]